jgi:hypothetical protein
MNEVKCRNCAETRFCVRNWGTYYSVICTGCFAKLGEIRHREEEDG